MGRHTRGEPIVPKPGQAPYGADGPPARLFAGLQERADRGSRTAMQLTHWEKAVAWVAFIGLAVVFLWLLPMLGVPSGWARWTGWVISHGPLYWAADRYAATHEPWRGPRLLRR